MLSEPRVTRIKHLKGNYLDEEFIRDFESQWNGARRMVIRSMNRYEKLYKENADFKAYVDSYMRNKTVSLAEVLSLKITRMVADEYEREQKQMERKYFSIWKS